MKTRSFSVRFGLNYPWTALIILALFCVLFMLLEIKNNRFWLSDFEVYYKAAQRILEGENLFRVAQDDFYVFKYSPTSALYFIPFTLLSFTAAKIAYWLFLTGCILYGFYLSLAMAGSQLMNTEPRRANLIFFAAAIILAVHFQRELHLGQVNHLLLVLYLAALRFFFKKKFITGSVWLAISVFIKPFALIFIPYFVVKKQYKALLFFVVFSVILFFLPMVFYPPSMFFEQSSLWLRELFIEMSNKQDLMQPANHTIFSVLARYSPLSLIRFTPSMGMVYQLTVMVTIGLLVLWFIFLGRNVENSMVAEFALLISLIPLLSFTSHNAFGFAGLAVFILLTEFAKFKVWEKSVMIAGFVLTGGNIHDLWGHDLSSVIEDLSLISIGTVFLLVILFIGRKRQCF